MNSDLDLRGSSLTVAWRNLRARRAVRRAVHSIAISLGSGLIWSVGKWVNARVPLPVPFDLLGGGVVVAVAASTIALAVRWPLRRVIEGVAMIAVGAIGLGAIRAYWWPPIRQAVGAFARSQPFAATIVAILLAFGVFLVLLVVDHARRPEARERPSSHS